MKEMKMFRYSIARLIFYKKQTIFYCLFLSTIAFLLMFVCNLYYLQATLYTQVEERLSFLSIATIKEHFSSFLSVKQFYVTLLLFLLFIFVVTFLFFFQRTLNQERREVIDWRLAGLSNGKIFLLIVWQLILPLVICCVFLLIWTVLFQNLYQNMLQSANLWSLKLFELPDTYALFSTSSQLFIPMDQQTFFKINFVDDTFFINTIKGFFQTVSILATLSLLLSVFQFSIFYRRLKKRKVIFYEHV